MEVVDVKNVVIIINNQQTNNNPIEDMKNKGINKIYFGIGIRPDTRTFNHSELYFYCFYLIKINDEGIMLRRGVNYNGFMLSKMIRFPVIGINY